MRIPCLMLLFFVAPLVAAAGAGQGARLAHLAQHTNTADVRSIALSRYRVWAATGGGLAVHSRDDGRFLFKLTCADGLPGNSLRLVRVLAGDRVLVGGDFGAAVLHHADHGRPEAGLEVLPIRNLSRPSTYSPVSALLEQPGPMHADGPILVVYQRGLLRLVTSPGNAVRVTDAGGPKGWWHSAALSGSTMVLGELTGRLYNPAKKKDIFLDGPILDLVGDEKGFVAATGEGLYRIQGERVRQLFVRENGAERPVAATVLATDGKSPLVGTAGGALYRLRESVLEPLVTAPGHRVTALAPDAGRMWIGLAKDGLHLFDGNQIGESLRPKGEICDNHVTSLARHRGWLVAGTFDRGACVHSNRGWRALALPSPMVHGLASDGRFLYVATSGGIARFGPRLQPRPIDQRDARVLRWLAGEAGIAAVRVHDGQVAVASRFGVVRVWRRPRGRTRVRFTSHHQGVPFKVTALASAANRIFVASETEGVVRLSFGDQGTWHLQDHDELPENWVTAISALDENDVWVATCQRGAAHVHAGKTRRFGRLEGLPDERLTAVAADKNGAFLGTLNGLAWVAAKGNSVKSFGLEDGIPDPRSASLYLEGEDLWLGTEAGVARFRIHVDRLERDAPTGLMEGKSPPPSTGGEAVSTQPRRIEARFNQWAVNGDG